jgi:hypothetical protein
MALSSRKRKLSLETLDSSDPDSASHLDEVQWQQPCEMREVPLLSLFLLFTLEAIPRATLAGIWGTLWEAGAWGP